MIQFTIFSRINFHQGGVRPAGAGGPSPLSRAAYVPTARPQGAS